MFLKIHIKVLDEMTEVANIGVALDLGPKEGIRDVNSADVAELADAQASGACAPWGVEVRLLSSALNSL
jgi:hypothetical protein